MEFEDVRLVQQYGVVHSRDGVDTKVEIGGRAFALPIVPSNMASVVGEESLGVFAEQGMFCIHHRFDVHPLDAYILTRRVLGYSSISVGVKNSDKRALAGMASAGLIPDYLTIDVSHGWHVLVKEMCEYVVGLFGEKPLLIVGNVGSARAVKDLEGWGVDVIKVGIAPGSLCSTYRETGFRSATFSTILECSKVANVPLIADGGVRCPGDVAKALTAGADLVMMGGEFMAHAESPGEVVGSGDKIYKSVYGSASATNKGEERYVEGLERLLPLKRRSLSQTITRYAEGLRSAVSFAGGEDLTVFNGLEWEEV